jgi:AcrR family transcriptional regulator
MGRPRQHDEATGEVLLAAAEQLLVDGGPDAISVRSVAELANTTTRAVYSVFSSKSGLIDALSRNAYCRLRSRIESLPVSADPSDDLVKVGAVAFRGFAIDNPHVFRLTFERVTHTVAEDPSVGEALDSCYRALAARVQRLAATVGLGGRQHDTVVFQFHFICQGLASTELQRLPPPVGSAWWSMLEASLDHEAIWNDTLSCFVSGIVR